MPSMIMRTCADGGVTTGVGKSGGERGFGVVADVCPSTAANRSFPADLILNIEVQETEIEHYACSVDLYP